MYSLTKETLPYGLGQNGLQALIDASIGALLKATIRHQEAHDVLIWFGL